ncbi:N-acetyltransferase [Cryobacterium frigoriphilum]|uniref:N-acetyltransferase n=1 Tax=Cryobacterium frigoriphilum TaxID=1259150 RepID=A0A4R9A9T0_9MICO|nr:GNAT family N-acetyltransferase [Cryobacterium frigoriphilum]TFD54048.1 N-acetyltransferase [Cryobacterium frigoriphilum]
MLPFTTILNDTITDDQALALYASVGWSTYTADPLALRRALDNSSFVVSARGENGELIGLARAISDDTTICYLQDILVAPTYQGSGVGRALLDQVTQHYAHVRQTVLITDDEPGQRAFYQALGFTEGSDFTPNALRMFALLR